MSPRIKVLALVGLVAAVVLGAGMLLLGQRQDSSAAAPAIKPLHPVKKTARKSATAPLPVKKAAVKPAPKQARKPRRRPVVIDGMPAKLASALAAHNVAVVALYAPKGRVDTLAVKEAAAGAAAAQAGFVAINVLDNKQSSPLAALVGAAPTPADRILGAPAVLVFQRPKTLYLRLNGFVDRDTVAQAAVNADLGAPAGE